MFSNFRCTFFQEHLPVALIPYKFSNFSCTFSQERLLVAASPDMCLNALRKKNSDVEKECAKII